MRTQYFKSLTILLLFLVSSSYANCGNSNTSPIWRLNNDFSTLSFISIKKTNVAEVHSFKKLSGKIKETGKVSIHIPLASLETNIPVRNERMKKWLFETDKFPKATITANIDYQSIEDLSLGQSLSTTVKAKINLHGQQQSYDVAVTVIRSTTHTLVVISQQPILIQTKDFALTQGVEKLREIAGLPSISQVVPVSFILTFNLTETE